MQLTGVGIFNIKPSIAYECYICFFKMSSLNVTFTQYMLLWHKITFELFKFRLIILLKCT